MKLLIIEDEFHAAQRLQKLIKQILDKHEILAVIDSVEDAVEWFSEHPSPDLIFMDIQLADDLSFSIFQKVEVNAPVIFTTAFDQYSLKAFKVNSIDYLLKPIDEVELADAIGKYQKINKLGMTASMATFTKLIESVNLQKAYKERFLIKQKDSYSFVLADEIAFFYSEDSVTFLVSETGKRYVFDATLSSIEKEVDPKKFFRINRKQLVHIKSIDRISAHFNNRLKLKLKQGSDVDTLVSRDKVPSFKNWLNA